MNVTPTRRAGDPPAPPSILLLQTPDRLSAENHAAYAALRAGDPSGADLEALAHCCMLTIALCGSGVVPDAVHVGRDALDALVTLRARRSRIGRYVPTVVERERLAELIDLLDAQLGSDLCGPAVLAAAMAAAGVRDAD